MKSSTRLIALPLCFAAVTFLGACQSTSFIAAESMPRAAVPVVLQANPDLLGGLVGREAVGSLATPGSLGHDSQLLRAQIDQRAYLIWKHSQRS